ncbi:hypothetical protein [Dokdonella soli]|uniref:Uncharacterized protein n=1 Tax=Dokdonella soli TaxID=529810 RepID=A0ABN1IE20_9GAMM
MDSVEGCTHSKRGALSAIPHTSNPIGQSNDYVGIAEIITTAGDGHPILILLANCANVATKRREHGQHSPDAGRWNPPKQPVLYLQQ